MDGEYDVSATRTSCVAKLLLSKILAKLGFTCVEYCMQVQLKNKLLLKIVHATTHTVFKRILQRYTLEVPLLEENPNFKAFL